MKNNISRSLMLDMEFMRIDISKNLKLKFLIKKYYLLAKHLLIKVSIGKDYIHLFDDEYYYNDKFGIAFLQSVYIDNNFLKKYIKKDSVVIDVGANIGQFNFFCQKYLKAKRCYSFEPIKESFYLLKKNAKNDDLFNCALGGRGKKQTLFVPETSLMASSIKPKKYRFKEVVSVGNISDYVKGNIDLIKIDTEGSELEVIKSNKKAIQKSRYVLVEASINRTTKGLVGVIEEMKSINPRIKIVELGRIYSFNEIQDSVDILFKNEK